MKTKEIKKRLEYLRKELKAEKISYSELIELQSLSKYIDKNDVELLQGAGIPENAADLFNTPELLPENVQAIIASFADETYTECERLLTELNQLGYTFDYYLDAQPYNLRKI